MLLALLAGCHLALGLAEIKDNPLPALTPLQQLGAENIASSPVTVRVSPTVDGDTLILVAAISTTSQTLTYVLDDANNSWVRGLAGDFSSTATPARIELWYAPAARPVSQLNIYYSDPRATAFSFSEWDGIDPTSTLTAMHAEPYVGVPLDAPTSGTLTVPEPSLVIGALAFGGKTTVAVEPGFTALDPFSASTGNISVAAGFTVVDPSDVSMSWTLGAPMITGSGIAALRVR